MGILSDVLDGLKNEPSKELLLSDALVFPAIDTEKLALVTELKQKATDDGSNDYPSSSSIELSSTEAEVIAKVKETLRPLYSTYIDMMGAYRARLSALDPIGFDAKMRSSASKKKSEVQLAIAESEGEIYLHQDNLAKREMEYADFKEKHGNPPDPIQIVPKWAKYLILAGVVAFEGILNSWFIGPYLQGGTLEALAYALGIPFLSLMIFGSVAGVQLRKFPVVSGFKKIIAAFLIAVSAAGSLALSFLLASLRLAAEGSDNYQDQAMSIWLSYLRLQPAESLNIPGVLLIAIGIALFAVAVIDVKSLDHPLEGFIEAYKARERAHEEYNAKKQEIHTKLRAVAHSAENISNSVDTLQLWQSEYQNILINQSQLSRKYDDYTKYIEDIVNTLLRKYRDINRLNRSTPDPAYFSNKWTFPEFKGHYIDALSQIEDFESKLPQVYEGMNKVQKDLEIEIRKITQVIDPFRNAVGGMKQQ